MSFSLDKATRDRILRVFLRSIPVPAGPEIYDLVANIKRSQTDLDVQVSQAVEALGNTSALINTLQQNLDERMAKLQRLREEHQRYSELAQIEAEKAAVLLKQVEATLGKDQKKERWIALTMHLGVGFLFFAMGVFVSDRFKEWMTDLWKHIK